MTTSSNDSFVPTNVLSGSPIVSLEASVASHRTTPASVPTCTVWNVPFAQVTMDQAIEQIGAMIKFGKPSYVITANLNYAMLNHQEPGMDVVTNDADLILADGQPIVWRSRLTGETLPERVAGSEMIFHLARWCRDNDESIYFLGGAENVAQTCADRLCERYPGLRIAGVESPPFRELTPEEIDHQQRKISASGAGLLLVAFGQPKGERWIHENHQALGVPVSIQLGASFDFIAGTAQRAPKFWQSIGMEWAYRMMTDPKRLVPRYAGNAAFLVKATLRELVQFAIRPR